MFTGAIYTWRREKLSLLQRIPLTEN